MEVHSPPTSLADELGEDASGYEIILVLKYILQRKENGGVNCNVEEMAAGRRFLFRGAKKTDSEPQLLFL